MHTTQHQLNIALITVCVDPNTADQVANAVNSLDWSVHTSNFEAYISAARRPYFGLQIKSAFAVVAVIDFDLNPEQAVESTKYLQQSLPGKVVVIGLSQSRNPDVLLLAMRAGCKEFLYKPFNAQEFHRSMSEQEQQWLQESGLATANGSVLSMLGAKGGVGTTTLAVHLAMYLVERHKKRTLLIDNHRELGHACVYLGINGQECLFEEVVRNVARLDSELLKSYVAHHASGLDVLASPDNCSLNTIMDGASVTRTLEFLRSEYDYVIVDCAANLDDVNVAVIDASTRVYLVATPEIGAIRDLSRFVDNLTRYDGATEKVDVIINRHSARFALEIEQIEKAIHLPVALRLPNCYLELVRAVNLGQPVPAAKKSEFALPMIKWTDTITGATGADKAAPKKEPLRFALWK